MSWEGLRGRLLRPSPLRLKKRRTQHSTPEEVQQRKSYKNNQDQGVVRSHKGRKKDKRPVNADLTEIPVSPQMEGFNFCELKLLLVEMEKRNKKMKEQTFKIDQEQTTPMLFSPKDQPYKPIKTPGTPRRRQPGRGIEGGDKIHGKDALTCYLIPRLIKQSSKSGLWKLKTGGQTMWQL
ncbi:hypothetical protein AKJ16_DCAP22491 [Drosera capensis]